MDVVGGSVFLFPVLINIYIIIENYCMGIVGVYNIHISASCHSDDGSNEMKMRDDLRIVDCSFRKIGVRRKVCRRNSTKIRTLLNNIMPRTTG